MTPSIFASRLSAPLFGDDQASVILSDQAFIDQMIMVEAGFARACGRVGLIPQDAAQRISDRLADITIAPADLGQGMATAGVPVPALVPRLQAELGADGQFLHWGATSQDIVDCAFVLQWRNMLDVLGLRLSTLLDTLQDASELHADMRMAARTRSQIATPITLGLRIATWAQPLIALEAELPSLRARLLKVQFGGASGSAGVVGDKAAALSAALAEELGLAEAPCWHSDRSAIVALSSWLAALAAGLSKSARDLVIMGRSEIAELRAGTGGGSSTMPQKSNPVTAEAMITLADFTASLQPLVSRAASPLEERDSAAWALEWLALPQMGVSVAACLRHSAALMASLRPDPARMQVTLQAENSAVLSEAASFALAAHMPRPKAQDVVKSVLALAREKGIGLLDALALHPDTAHLEDITAMLSSDAQSGAARDMAQRIFQQRNR